MWGVGGRKRRWQGISPARANREEYDRKTRSETRNVLAKQEGKGEYKRGVAGKGMKKIKKKRKALFCPFYREKRTFRLDWAKPAWPLQSEVEVVLSEGARVCVC